MTLRAIRPLGLLLIACAAAPASAELPGPVRAMIDAAIATGDAAKVKTVVELAKQTNPEDVAEIEALDAGFQAQLAETVAAEQARKEEEIRTAGLFENWSGKGQVGAFQSSGNSDDAGVSLALNLDRKGIDWQHKLRANMDYRRSNGETSREQYLLAYEPRFSINPDLFAYSLAQYERNRLQGFLGRYSVSGGFGYNVIDTPSLDLSIKAGPAFRRSEFVDGTSEDRLGGLAGLDFDWRITDRLTFTQDSNMIAETGGSATVIVDSSRTTLALVTGLEAKMTDRLTTRLSYAVDYDSNPPAEAVSTDTLTRFTLVYGF
jgi:putative salt-induced outer membrane protein